METTLEARWFCRGLPPAVVQRWFGVECPGEQSAKLEVREDLYASIEGKHLDVLTRFLPDVLGREAVNLKLREGNLELKLKQHKLGICKFGLAQKSRACEGKIEQWCKLNEEDIPNLDQLPILLPEMDWIVVEKERKQKIERGVKGELTWLKIDRERWWTVAFEMAQDRLNTRQNGNFQSVVAEACETYRGPMLSATNSFGYSHWLLRSLPQILPKRKYKLSL